MIQESKIELKNIKDFKASGLLAKQYIDEELLTNKSGKASAIFYESNRGLGRITVFKVWHTKYQITVERVR